MMLPLTILVISSLVVITTCSDETIKTPTNALCPNNPNSSCVKIFDCEKLYQLYRQGEPRDQQSLRAAYCGWENGAPKVCCANVETNRRKRSSNAPVCGISAAKTSSKSNQRTKRLTGKTRKALLDSWPWIAALYYNRSGCISCEPRFGCGGALISSEWILTAAHCVSPTGSQKLSYVQLGDLNIDEDVVDGATPIKVNVKQIIQHPQFSTRPRTNNIALVRLSKPVEYTEHIRPICVRGGDKKYSNESYYGQKKAVMIGWGVTSYGGIPSSDLLEVDLDVVPSVQCSKNYALDVAANTIKMDESMICANTNDGNDACRGDSGGPLMFQDNDIWWVAGISAGGRQCGVPEYPSFYTKVPRYVDWIETTTGIKFQ